MKFSVPSYLNGLLHLFFPHNCIACYSEVFSGDAVLCTKCFTSLPQTNFFQVAENAVATTFYGRVPIENAGATFYFTKDSIVQSLMVALKYKGIKTVGHFLGNETALAMLKSNWYHEVDFVVPMPLNPAKERRRGYNQAALIAEGIALKIGRPLLQNAVARPISTETQTQKNRVERWHTMKNAFEVTDKAKFMGKHILLVDDVVTTGATLEACAAILIAECNAKVSIACAAYTSH